MNEHIRSYIGYEYKKILADREMASVYADGYENFGWKLEDKSPSLFLAPSILTFKRDRKLRNKAELTRLQRQFESCVSDVISLEKSKTLKAIVAAYTIGVLGAACMAGAVFAFLGSLTTLMVVLAIPAVVGWVLPYFCYRKLIDRKTEQVSPLIDRKYDEIYEVCEKANCLLA